MPKKSRETFAELKLQRPGVIDPIETPEFKEIIDKKLKCDDINIKCQKEN